MSDIETAEYWLTGPHHIQQVGQSAPEYVDASPTNPVKVVLPAKILRKGEWIDRPETQFMRRVKPAKPQPVHAGRMADPVKKSHEARAEKPQQQDKAVRAADR